MALRFDIISIGTLSRNPFWNEKQPVRTAHATTTLIRDGTHAILVDPSLPPEILVHRLPERVGLLPDAIDAVFLTTFRPIHRRGLELFARATWLMAADEIAAMKAELDAHRERADRGGMDDDALVADERRLLDRMHPATDKLTPRVHLFPTAGPSRGSASLLLVPATQTIAVVGDVVLTRDHLEAGRVMDRATDVEQARESLSEVIEIADQIIPGHDNLIVPFARNA